MIKSLTFDEIIRRIRVGNLKLTRDELDDLFMIIDNPLGNLEVDWQENKIKLKGLNVEFSFHE